MNKILKKETVVDEEPAEDNCPVQAKPSNIEETIFADELNSGVIRLDTMICDFTTTSILRRIEYLRSKGIKKIKFIITSPGGSYHHAMALYDRILLLPKQGIKTEALVEGMAASAASMILLQAVQKRTATDSSRLLIHEPRRWTTFEMETSSELQDNAKEISIIANKICSLLAKRTKKTRKEIAGILERKDVWMSSQEAKKFGLIDNIIK